MNSGDEEAASLSILVILSWDGKAGARRGSAGDQRGREACQRRTSIRYRERKKASAEAKSDEPAPSPAIEPEAQRELTEIERAMAWRPPEHRR
jgi:hypothetical protein